METEEQANACVRTILAEKEHLRTLHSEVRQKTGREFSEEISMT